MTPEIIVNRPGLRTLDYRVGDYATFLSTMLARLTDHFMEVPSESGNDQIIVRPLLDLKTRDLDDPAIAMLDAWAMLGDVLTFYQERIANEGFLRTALERRSVLELAKLVGYKLRPGVAASVYLAFEIEKDASFNISGSPTEPGGTDKDRGVIIPKGTKAQSIPGPDEMPQIFETSEDIKARFVWNKLLPRQELPPYITSGNIGQQDVFYFKSTATNLRPNSQLLFVFGNEESDRKLRVVERVIAEPENDRTKVFVQRNSDAQPNNISVTGAFLGLRDFIPSLLRDPSRQPQNALRRQIGVKKSFSQGSDIALKLLSAQNPRFRNTIYQAWRGVNVSPARALQSVESFAIKTAPFGHDAPMRRITDNNGNVVATLEWPLVSQGYNVRLFDVNQKSITKALEAGSITVELTSAFQENVARAVVNIPAEQSSGPYLGDLCGTSVSITTNRVEGSVSISSIELTISNSYNRTITLTPINEDKVSLQILKKFNQKLNLGDFKQNVKTNLFVSYTGIFSITETEDGDYSGLRNILTLDGVYDEIVPGSWVAINRPNDNGPIIRKVESTKTLTKTGYNLSKRVTELLLDKEWLEGAGLDLSNLRATTVYAQSSPLELANVPIEEDVAGNVIELDGLHEGLTPGRWAVLSGERTDITDNPGSGNVRASEVVMVTNVTHSPGLLDNGDPMPGDTLHTRLHLANSLAYAYKRETVSINTNVSHATHGETREQVLGSGASSQEFQQFKLAFVPLTHIAATTPSGIASSLKVFVNDVEWDEAKDFALLKQTDRNYVAKRDNEENTFVLFGNGETGARVPTGVENVTAKYRSGIGKAGNVKDEQVSMLMTKPLGVKSVINPRAASGGADAENIGEARLNAATELLAMGRAVSVPDYADFARAFSGIDKAEALRISDGRREIVHVTIAGADNIPIDRNSDLFRNLQQALVKFGDPFQPLAIDIRELMLIIISAQVKILPGYQWEIVEPKIRERMLDEFSFKNRQLGQDVLLSAVFSTIQSVEGVDYVDVDVLDAFGERQLQQSKNLGNLANELADEQDQPLQYIPVNLARVDEYNKILPAQLAFLTPEVPDTLLLKERS